MLQTARFACFGALGANLLFGCGAPEHFAPPPESSASGEAAPLGDEPESATGETREREPAMLGEGLLEIATRSSGPSFLGSTHCVVEDAEGRVVAGADEESSEGSASQVSQLSLLLPAGEAYTLRLTASIEDARPTICRATVGPVQVEAGSVARVHVFAWDCGDRIGYVPQAAQDDCYWLADWSFVGPTSVPLGGVVDAGVVAERGAGTLAYRWSSSAPELGGFSAPGAPQTALRCLAAGENLPFQVSISDGVCEQLVTQVVSCRSQ